MPAQANPSPLVISIGLNRWDEKWSSRQQVMREFARQGWTVVFVEPPSRPGHRAKDGWTFARIEERLFRYIHPRWLVDFHESHPVLRAINEWLRSALLRLRLRFRGLSGKRRVLYLWHPKFAASTRSLPADVVCYHKVDRYPSKGTITPAQAEEELELIRRAAVRLTVSDAVVESGPQHEGFHVVPNGVSFDEFDTARRERERSGDTSLARIPGPRIGYVGAINRKVDVELLVSIATEFPDCSLVMIGPVREDEDRTKEGITALRDLPNVHFLGLVPFEQLPACVADLDVGLMPYRLEKDLWCYYGSPLKMHEYLACGLPVVSVPIPAVLPWEGTIALAETPQQWHDAVRDALAVEARGPEAVARRVDAARSESWAAKTKVIRDWITTALDPSAGGEDRVR